MSSIRKFNDLKLRFMNQFTEEQCMLDNRTLV